MADSTKALPENDIELKIGQVNQFIRIGPDASFVCAKPFGTEHLLAYGSETAFCLIPSKPKLYLRLENGYTALVNSLMNFRSGIQCTGIKSAVTEDRIQLTTRGN